MTKKPADPIASARAWLAGCEQRQAKRIFAVPPGIPVAQLNGERVDNDHIVSVARKWLQDTARVGSPADLQRAFDAFQPYHHLLRHGLRGEFDGLMQQCIARDVQMRGIVSNADAVLGAEREQKRRAESERAAIKAERAKLDAREQKLAEVEARP